MSVFWQVRVGVFAFVLLCTVILFGLSANAVAVYGGDSLASSFIGTTGTTSVPAFAGLVLAVSIISLLTVTPMLVIDFLRRGAISSWIMTELGVLGVLWVLWLAAAAESVAGSPFRLLRTLGVGSGCGVFDSALRQLAGSDDDDRVSGFPAADVRDALQEGKSLCQQQQAIQAFAFLGWLALFGYFIALLTFSVLAFNKGNKAVWNATVRDTDFFAPGDANNVPMKQQIFAPQNTGGSSVAPQPVYSPSQGYTTAPTPPVQQYQAHPYQAQASPYAAQV